MKLTSKRQATLALTLIASTAILASCALMTGTSVSKHAGCESFKPITWSPNDTDETLKQIKAHNAVWKSLCAR